MHNVVTTKIVTPLLEVVVLVPNPSTILFVPS